MKKIPHFSSQIFRPHHGKPIPPFIMNNMSPSLFMENIPPSSWQISFPLHKHYSIPPSSWQISFPHHEANIFTYRTMNITKFPCLIIDINNIPHSSWQMTFPQHEHYSSFVMTRFPSSALHPFLTWTYFPLLPSPLQRANYHCFIIAKLLYRSCIRPPPPHQTF